MSCDRPDYVIVDYALLEEKEVKCIIENATPVKEVTDIVIDGKYYKSDDPEIDECLKDL
jgi:hypothetical protein